MTPSRADADAFERAIQSALKRETEAERMQVERMLERDPWEQVGEFCAYGCQCRNLKLRPWQWPPCWCEPGDRDPPGGGHRGITKAARLVERLYAVGLSKFEPDPLGQLAKAEAAAKKATPPLQEGNEGAARAEAGTEGELLPRAD
jgi:hypothetical protein